MVDVLSLGVKSHWQCFDVVQKVCVAFVISSLPGGVVPLEDITGELLRIYPEESPRKRLCSKGL